MTALREFGGRVWNELLRSLGDTVGFFDPEAGLAMDAALADLALRLVVVAILAAVFWIVYRVLRMGLRGLTRRVAFLEGLEETVLGGLRAMLVTLALLAMASQFGIPSTVLASAAIAALLAFAFYAAWIVGNLLLTNAVRSADLDRSLEQLLRNVLAVTVVALGGIAVLQQFGINVLSVITALGVVGIAVGFAAQETLSNFIAGITLLVERPFRIGDWVEVSGKVGRVERISLRTTRLVDRDNVITSIPNASVASSEIVNLSAGGPLRARIAVGIAYKESAAQARDVILPVVTPHPKVLGGAGYEPGVVMSELGDSSVNLTVLFWIAPEDIGTMPKIAAEILEGVKEALDDVGIEIPFPHLQLFIDEAKGLPPVLEPFARPLAAGPGAGPGGSGGPDA